MLRGALRLSTLLLFAVGCFALGLPRIASAQSRALSPVIGVIPTSLDFGVLCPGLCRDTLVSVRNAVDDPKSRLVIADLLVTPPFALVNPPPLPLIIMGNGTQIQLFLRYCAAGSGPQNGSLTIHANASNSPLVVPLIGTADPPPQCAAGGPYFGPPNQPITFDGRESSDPGGEIVSYTWDFGDGATGTGSTVVHTYALKGTYVVTLTVTDACGSSSSCQTTADVSSNLRPVCDVRGPYRGAVGQPVTFDGTHSHDPDGTIVGYAWDFGDGATATGATPSHIYSAPGFFRISLEVIDDAGARSVCATNNRVVDCSPHLGRPDNLDPVQAVTWGQIKATYR